MPSILFEDHFEAEKCAKWTIFFKHPVIVGKWLRIMIEIKIDKLNFI